MTDMRAKCDEVRKAMNEALHMAGDQVDGDFSVGNMRYNDLTISVTVEFAVRGEDGERVDPRLAKLRHAWPDWDIMDSDAVYTLPTDSLDKTFRVGSEQHTIAGYNRRARKNPVITTTPDGRQWRWPIAGVCQHLGIPRNTLTITEKP